jgi:hypothetical protein
MKAVNEEYLGDGLYVSFDGYSIWLRAPRREGDHYVALEPLMFQELLRYVVKQGWTIDKIKKEDVP